MTAPVAPPGPPDLVTNCAVCLVDRSVFYAYAAVASHLNSNPSHVVVPAFSRLGTNASAMGPTLWSGLL